jgi:HTH-type transcriptional regulator/antitoxin HipB
MENPIDNQGNAFLSKMIGRQARSAREEKGFSIRVAAGKFKCSPRFVHQLEQGKPTARMDKVLQMLSGLGLQLTVHKKGVDPVAALHWKERIEARAKQRLYEERLGRAHERIAAKLALGELEPGAIERARDQVRKWDEHRICSKWYVDRWSEILDGPSPQIASKLLGLDRADAKALFQNTPFGFLVREQLRA